MPRISSSRAYHVVKSVYKSEAPSYVDVQSVLGGSIYAATTVAATNPDRDIAVLRVPNYPAPPLPFADSDTVYIPQPILIAGSPKGYIGTVHSGHVSAIRNHNFNLLNGKIIQIMMPTAPGFSGAPVINLLGQVIGIHVASVPDSENMAIIVPSNTIKTLADSISPPRIVH